MKGLNDIRQRIESLKAAMPKSEPWPPEEGSFSWCLWMKLEQPGEKMRIIDMYNTVAEIVWAGEPTADMSDFEEVSECWS